MGCVVIEYEFITLVIERIRRLQGCRNLNLAAFPATGSEISATGSVPGQRLFLWPRQ